MPALIYVRYRFRGEHKYEIHDKGAKKSVYSAGVCGKIRVRFDTEVSWRQVKEKETDQLQREVVHSSYGHLKLFL